MIYGFNTGVFFFFFFFRIYGCDRLWLWVLMGIDWLSGFSIILLYTLLEHITGQYDHTTLKAIVIRKKSDVGKGVSCPMPRKIGPRTGFSLHCMYKMGSFSDEPNKSCLQPWSLDSGLYNETRQYLRILTFVRINRPT